ncbi:MAG: isoprenoid biosynthesis glyoxalase ElbB [Thermoanaerobaculia bacterium]
MPKVGVVLSGSGVFDGSEIHEATLTLLFLDKKGAEIIIMAPDMEQKDTINHLKQEPMKEKRNVLVEAARIARGNIKNIKDVKVDQLDALIFPGGFGAAKNLSDFAEKGENCTLHPEVERLIKDMHKEGKPMGFICIAPVLAAKALGNKVQVTIGNDPEVAKKIEKMGAYHIECPVDMAVIDSKNRIVSTPAYMLASSIKELESGIKMLVNNVLKLIK